MGCSACEKKRKLLIEQARQRLEAGIVDEVVRKRSNTKGTKDAPVEGGNRSICPYCANYRFYCKCKK